MFSIMTMNKPQTGKYKSCVFGIFPHMFSLSEQNKSLLLQRANGIHEMVLVPLVAHPLSVPRSGQYMYVCIVGKKRVMFCSGCEIFHIVPSQKSSVIHS